MKHTHTGTTMKILTALLTVIVVWTLRCARTRCGCGLFISIGICGVATATNSASSAAGAAYTAARVMGIGSTATASAASMGIRAGSTWAPAIADHVAGVALGQHHFVAYELSSFILLLQRDANYAIVGVSKNFCGQASGWGWGETVRINYFKICWHTRGTKILKKYSVFHTAAQHNNSSVRRKKYILNRNSAAFASHLSTVGRATYESHFVANDRGRSVLSNTLIHTNTLMHWCAALANVVCVRVSVHIHWCLCVRVYACEYACVCVCVCVWVCWPTAAEMCIGKVHIWST